MSLCRRAELDTSAKGAIQGNYVVVGYHNIRKTIFKLAVDNLQKILQTKRQL